jgi:hypothetical protein
MRPACINATLSLISEHATGHPCACPYDIERNGRPCGRVEQIDVMDGHLVAL